MLLHDNIIYLQYINVRKDCYICFPAKKAKMAQVSPRYEQNLFITFKTKGFPKVLNPCGSNQSELLSIVGSKQHSKAELVLFQRKKHDTHLLSKLSPYFRSCISQEFLETKQSTAGEKLPSLCYSCNRSLDRRLDNSGSFQTISEGYQRFPKTVEDFRRLTKRAEEPPISFNRIKLRR